MHRGDYFMGEHGFVQIAAGTGLQRLEHRVDDALDGITTRACGKFSNKQLTHTTPLIPGRLTAAEP